ncbi:hypothetical protein ISS39_09085 [Candidatus Bathyarchaeota archaeon]|nr:hypothetical protein [Candidatus Bathyarchaeota archaeon]
MRRVSPSTPGIHLGIAYLLSGVQPYRVDKSEVVIPGELLDSLLLFAKMQHPREALLLLRGGRALV